MEVADGSEALQRGADRRELREAEKLQGQGMTIPQSCKRLGISDQTSLIERGSVEPDEIATLDTSECDHRDEQISN